MQCVLFRDNVPPESFAAAKELKQEASVTVRGTIREDKRSHIGYEMDVADLHVIHNPGRRLPDLSQGARAGLPDDQSPPLGEVFAAARDSDGASRADPADTQLLRQQRLHADGHAHLHALGVRGHHHAVRDGLCRRQQGVSVAVGPALQRGQRHGVRPGVLLRTDVPRGEIQHA